MKPIKPPVIRFSEERKKPLKFCSECGAPIRSPAFHAHSPEFPEAYRMPRSLRDRDIIR